MPNDVWITGIGVMVAGAQSVERFWGHLADGESQVDVVPAFADAGLRAPFGARITDFDHRRYLPDLSEDHAAKYGREVLIAMSAAAECLRDAGLAGLDMDPRRIGFIDASSRGPLAFWRDHDHPDTPYSPSSAVLRGLPGGPATLTAIRAGMRGSVGTLSSACIGGGQAIGMGLRELLAGDADVMLAGGHEFPLLPELADAYRALGVLATRAEDPQSAMRPYDRRRDGFVLGEGAIVLCLERADTARNRGARAYASILGHRSRNEGLHPFTPQPTGEYTRDLVAEVLDRCGRTFAEVGYVCGHGSGTVAGDLAENRAIRALHNGAPDPPPPLGSVKPVYGHLLGASMLVNVAATALMIHHQRLVPTVNCTEPDPRCDLDHVTDGPRAVSLDLAIALSFALGSQSSAVALGRVP